MTPYITYCDMTSNPPWTLFQSFSRNNLVFFQALALNQESGGGAYNKDLTFYGSALSQVTALRSRSKYWRVTSNMDTAYSTDYAVGLLSTFDVMTFSSTGGTCMPVERVSLRGTTCTDCQSKWWQAASSMHLHLDSGSGSQVG